MLCIDRCFSVIRGFLYFILFTILALSLSSCGAKSLHGSDVTADNLTFTTGQGSDNKQLFSEKSAPQLTTLGNIYLEKRNLDLAKVHFATALKKNPNFAEAYVGLGRIEMHNGSYASALRHFKHAEDIDSNLLDAVIGQAQALRFEGKLNTAVSKINEAMAVSPNNIKVLKELAILYDLMGHENLAEPLYNEIINTAPDVASSHNNLGMNQLVQKKYPAAILSFLQALSLNKESARIKNNLATAYALNGDEDQALKIFTGTVGEAAAHNNLGYLFMTQGKFDIAENHLKKAMSSNPKYYLKAQDNLEKLEQMRRSSLEQ